MRKTLSLISLAIAGLILIGQIYFNYSSYKHYYFDYNNKEQTYDVVQINFPHFWDTRCYYSLYIKDVDFNPEMIEVAKSKVLVKRDDSTTIEWEDEFYQYQSEDEVAIVRITNCKRGKMHATFEITDDEYFHRLNKRIYIQRKIIGEYEIGNGLINFFAVLGLCFFLFLAFLIDIFHYRTSTLFRQRFLFWLVVMIVIFLVAFPVWLYRQF